MIDRAEQTKREEVRSPQPMAAVSQDRPYAGPAMLSVAFRPFFFMGSLWAAIAIPVWLAAYARGVVLPSAIPPALWHAHEMIFGFAVASVAGFLLTAVPNWTGRKPLQGWPLATLVLLWLGGRLAVLFSAATGAPAAALADLSFPLALLGVIANDIL